MSKNRDTIFGSMLAKAGVNLQNNVMTVLPVSKYTRPGITRDDTKAIVWHYVGNPGSTAIGNRNWFASLPARKKYASCNLIIGLRGEVLQLMPLDEVSYTSGGRHYKPGIRKKLGGNVHRNTLGIECCHIDRSGMYDQRTMAAMIAAGAALAKAYDLDPEKHFLRHYDITGKQCPRWMVENPAEWNRFKRKCKEYMAKF